ncbi:hypothetical protein DERP_007086 [Dermatophagoides pteronyssinus]|uniref:Uncharacterized protein n=1 Tax=Dermatophagoides pteronyssinus TaxID=6956 RepID=A0ABQ8JV09_DERPT|nr:hypothetical protein DERP_007086 [Dermatophagoides pteronyssinus]
MVLTFLLLLSSSFNESEKEKKNNTLLYGCEQTHLINLHGNDLVVGINFSVVNLYRSFGHLSSRLFWGDSMENTDL